MNVTHGWRSRDHKRKALQADCALYAPSQSTEPDKYMAETPSFPNCVAWGDTPQETIEILESVVATTIQAYRERGYHLPPGVVAMEAETARSS